MFANLGAAFEQRAPDHPALVRALQNQVSAAVDLDEKIRRQENRNRRLLEQASLPGMEHQNNPPPQKSSKKHVLALYKNNAKKKQ